MSSAITGTDSASPTQSRRVMSSSSGLGSLRALGISGSSAMPQIGQEPGACCRISGCIGQVKIVPSGIGAVDWRAAGSRYFAGSAANFVRQPPEQKK